mgnify:CR=1 FL=1
MTTLIKNRRKDFLRFEKRREDFLKTIKVPKNLNYFFLNKKGYNLNLINQFIKTNSNKKNISILDICVILNNTIPHYCYHFNLSIAGNCRMCLVELSSSLKPIVACAVDLAPNQKISTDTFLVTRARQGIMEFLLVNHPLDCPVCDQGGECDLQDQSLIYGSDRGRFYHVNDLKRSVTDIMCNHFVKLTLTRCIHCTRCVRFLNEVAGDYTLGMLGRGNSSEIGLYTDSVLTSELSSNITDFCPVGALTIKPYALNKRPWEEVYLESIDLSDSLCVPLRVYSNGKKINRILPQYNTDLDLSWITERTRYLSDGLLVQQLDYPCIKVFSSLITTETMDEENIYFDNFYNENYGVYFYDENKALSYSFNSNMLAISWKSIGYFILNKMKNQYGFLCSYYTGEFLDLETMVYIKESALYYGSNSLKSLSEKHLNISSELVNEDFDSNYLLKLSNFEKYENIFFVDLNLRLENPILNAKLRQKFVWGNHCKIYYFGAKYNLTYKYIQLGVSTKNLLRMVEGRYSILNDLKKTKKSNLFLYNNNLKLLYKPTFHRSLFNYLKNLNNSFELMYLPKTAASVGSMDISLNRYVVKKKIINLKRKINMNYNLFYYIGCNDIKVDSGLLNKYKLIHKTFFYQNSHGDNFFNFADYFFPSYSFLEKQSGYYINCFGIFKKNRQLVLPRNEFVQDDKDIVRLIHKMIFDINFNSKPYINKQSNMALYSYIPIYLFAKRRMNFYNILENQITYSSVYFYVYSSKNKNSFKNSIFATYSANLNMISYLHFSKKSNLTL